MILMVLLISLMWLDSRKDFVNGLLEFRPSLKLQETQPTRRCSHARLMGR
jgi:hypothetical protein